MGNSSGDEAERPLTMKLHDINAFGGCYIYSTSHRFCFPFTFAPFTTVGPLDRDFSKAISIMWNRKDRGQLRALHDYLMRSLIAKTSVAMNRFNLK
jgi:hypothetical protein